MKAHDLYVRYGLNDLKRNKGMNVSLAAILVLSAFLMATGAMVMERLVSSVDQLFAIAKPPHFLQMHKGAYDTGALQRFADQHPEIDSWLIQTMVGFDSSAIARNRPGNGGSGDLSESLIDNLFVAQNATLDFLVDENGAIPTPTDGQVYLPVAYQQRFHLQAGDELRIGTDSGVRTLQVVGFVRDAQMASSLSSATRFLVSADDLRSLLAAGGGSPEIMVEYRLTNVDDAASFQQAYESTPDLPRNGQAVTYQMIRMINAFSDGLVAVALVFVSVLLIVIALLNLRFVIRGTLEDEVREIGAMKAIGLPDRDVSALYLTKYSVMTLVACVAGGLLAVGASALLTQGVQVSYAAAPISAATVVVPLLALAVVYLIVVAICRTVLRGVRRIQVVNALVQGSTLGEKQTARVARRQARRVRSTSLAELRGGLNVRLALLDLRAEARQWVLVPIVFALAAVLMTLPLNLLSTFESPRFVTYMGAPESDLRADVQFSPDVSSIHTELLAALEADPRIVGVRDYATVLYEVDGAEGWETVPVEVGDYTDGGIEFLTGTRPRDGQIALSVLSAEQFGVTAGDVLSLRRGATTVLAEVSGTYQDVTSGGRTAKLQGRAPKGAVGYVVYATLAADVDAGTVAAEFNERFPAASVIPMREYVQQTLSYVTDAFRNAAILAFAFGLGVAVLITSLFLKLRLTRERRTMGVLAAIGFSSSELAAQIRLKTLLAVGVGTLAGTLVAATAGEGLVGGLIALTGLGIAELRFITNPWLVYLGYPLILNAAGLLTAVTLTTRLRTADKSMWLRG